MAIQKAPLSCLAAFLLSAIMGVGEAAYVTEYVCLQTGIILPGPTEPARSPVPPRCPLDPNEIGVTEWAQCGRDSAGCGMNFTPFLILFGGQTGTGHLAQDMLGKHQQVTWIGEGHDDCFMDMLKTGTELPTSKVVVGTKTRMVDVVPLLNVYLPPSTRFIHITRRNAIAWGLSKLHKEELKACRGSEEVAQGEDNCSAIVYARKRVNVTSLKRYVEEKVESELERNRTVSALTARNYQVLEIGYEDLLADEALVLSRITAFLGIHPYKSMESNVIKRGAKDLRDSFANWEEVVAAFCGTKFEPALGLASNESCDGDGQ